MRGDWLIRRLARRIIPQAIILLYHRVADATFDPQLLCVSPKHFAEQMEILRAAFRPNSLRTLSERKLLNLWPPRTVVVTFDDGYADNLVNAKPILQQYDIPATVFVTTEFIGGKQLPYWDELANLFLQTPSLPPRLSLVVKGDMKTWEFGSEPPVDASWNLLQGCNLARQDAYMVLCDLLRSVTPTEREETLTEIRRWSGKAESVSTTNRFMTADELGLLTDGGLVEIGAHTMTHPDLALLTLEEQRSEIVQGRLRLEEMAGQKVHSFSYPYGTRDNYTGETVQIMKDEGFDCACSNFGGTVWFGSDLYQLPRVLVRNWSAEEFTKNINGYFR